MKYNYFGNSPNGWTDQQVREIEEKYFPGFLHVNPHYPAPGIYRNQDGSLASFGSFFTPTIPEEPVMINGYLWDKVDYADEEENAP